MGRERSEVSPPVAMGAGFIRQHHSLLSAAHQLVDILINLGLLALFVALAGGNWDVYHQIAAFVTSLLFHIYAHKNGLYLSWRGQSLWLEVRAVHLAWLVVLGAFFSIVFIFNVVDQYQTGVITAWAITVPMAISLYRVSARMALREFRRAGINVRRVAIVGAKEPGLSLAKSMLNSSWMGMQIAGFYDDEAELGEYPLETLVVPPRFNDREAQEHTLKVMGDLEALVRDARSGNFDEIYIALPMRKEELIKSLVESLADSSCSVHIVPDIFTFKMLNARSREIGGLPVVSVYSSPFDSFDAAVKRLEDVILSSFILCLIAVPMLLIAAAVKLTSAGPVLFKQRRYGINGEEIEVWKFRTMTTCDDGEIVTQASRNDSRVTWLGKILRRTSLDELPQFFNVLQGSMSLVGPRPHAVAHNELYRERINGYMQRHLVKPGITGWAQISGWRGETDTIEKMEKRVEFDLYYIRHWSVWFDLKIILLTLVKGFFSSKAY